MKKIVIGAALFITWTLFAETVSNCHIHIKQITKDNDSSEKTHDLPMKDKKSCEKASKVHETNFAPHLVAKKIVTFTFDEVKKEIKKNK